MFIKLNSGDMINLYWLDNFYIDKYDDTKIIYVYVNGARKEEKFSSSNLAETRFVELQKKIFG